MPQAEWRKGWQVFCCRTCSFPVYATSTNVVAFIGNIPVSSSSREKRRSMQLPQSFSLQVPKTKGERSREASPVIQKKKQVVQTKNTVELRKSASHIVPRRVSAGAIKMN